LETKWEQKRVEDILNLITENIPRPFFGGAHSLNQLVGIKHKRTVIDFRNRNKEAWTEVLGRLKNEHKFVCGSFRESGCILDAKGKKLPPDTWVIYKDKKLH